MYWHHCNGGCGTKIQQHRLSFGDDFKWSIRHVGGEEYEFTLNSNGLKLDVAGGSSARGTILHEWTGNGSPAQRFKLHRLPYPKDTINSLKEDVDHLRKLQNTSIIEFSKGHKKISKEDTYLFNSMTGIIIPTSVEEIFDDAFSDHDISHVECDPKWLCKFKKDKLKTIGVLPSASTNIVYINQSDFEGCSNLENLRIVFEADTEEKDLLSKIEKGDLLDNVKIEEGALDNLQKIKSFIVLIKPAIKGASAIGIDLTKNIYFGYYLNLYIYNKIRVPDGITKIRANRFRNKKYLRNIILPDSIKEIEENAFEGCENLQEIVLPEGITKIPAGAFKNCKNLKKLTIPNSVTTIDETAFEGCNLLCSNNVNCHETHKQIFDKIVKVPYNFNFLDTKFKNNFCNAEVIEMPDEGLDEDKVCDKLSKLDKDIKAKFITCSPKVLSVLNNRGNFEGIFISEGTQEIGKASFENCKNVTFIGIPNSVKKNEEGTFNNCNNINFVKCPLRLLGSFNKANLNNIIINEEVDIKSINFEEFSGCKNLKSIVIPDSWIEDEKITNQIFEKCNNLSTIQGVSGKQIIYLRNLKIPDGVTRINKNEYGSCCRLNALIIPKTVESIEDGTFKNCVNLKNVKADPKWLNDLPKSRIEKLVIPKWVSEMDERCFDGCYNLKELIFESADTKLCGESSCELKGIKRVKCSAKTASTMHNDVRHNIEELEISEGSKEICSGEISEFYSLKDIILPESLEKIDSKGLSNCSNLKYIKITRGVKNIAADAFENSKNIDKVKCSLNLLKYLPKNQIETIILNDNNIDKVPEKELEGYEKLNIIVNEYFEVLYLKNEDIHDQPKLKREDIEETNSEEIFKECKTVDKGKEEPKQESEVAPPPEKNDNEIIRKKETTIEDLVRSDPNNEKYKEYVKSIREDTIKGENRSRGAGGLEGISKTITEVCIEIKKKTGRIPYTVQILIILRLSAEIINGK